VFELASELILWLRDSNAYFCVSALDELCFYAEGYSLPSAKKNSKCTLLIRAIEHEKTH
jgi:hypothetical protein